ncbi:MAG TPA: energy transducer TonB [Flavobacterium sp.]|nr:energy transducer TonB [Flavobacterium sp.]
MSNLNVFNRSWNEIVFEGRNKEYGAYQLRRENPKTTLRALFFALLLCVLLVSIPIISGLLKEGIADNHANSNPILPPVTVVRLQPLEQPKKAVPAASKPAESETAKPKLEKSSAKQDIHARPRITDQPVTANEMEPLDLDKPVKTGSTANPGDEDGAIALGKGSPTGTGTGTPHTVPGGNGPGTIFPTGGLDSNPDFPGGIQNFLKEVGKRFKTPDLGEKGIMKIYVAFVVEIDGSLSNIKVARDPGYGLGDEAIRVLKSIKTKWSPGIQNGKPVRTAYNLPISVVIKDM